MSNVEILKGLYEAFRQGDTQSVIAGLHPEIEWVEPELEGLLYGGTHRGLEAVIDEVLAVIPQTWERVELEPEEWIDGGDTVVVIGTFNARGKAGRDGSWRFAHVWQMLDGKGARVEPFIDTLAELRALGGVP